MAQLELKITRVRGLNFASKQTVDKEGEIHTLVTVTLTAAMSPEDVAQLATIQDYGAIQCSIATRQVGFGDTI